MLLTLTIVLGLVATTMLPASAGPRRSYEIDQERLAGLLTVLEGTAGATTHHGELDGALWVAQVPDDWNGHLLTWAHGYRGEGPSLYVDPPPAHDWLLDNGYAWIASSYRRNSYDPGIGVIDTKNATRYFRDEFGGDGNNYLAGVSMGGHVTAAAIEKYPNLWDGASPHCGVVGDVELFDYFLDYNLGAAAIAGLDPDGFEYPTDDWTTTTVPTIKEALSFAPDTFQVPDPTSPTGFSDRNIWASTGKFGLPPVLTPLGQEFKDFVEVGSGGDRGEIYDWAWDYWHLGANPTGDFFFDLGEGSGEIADRAGIVSQNSDTVYAEEYGFDIDDDVARITAANRVRRSNGTKPAPIIHGTPDVPVLALHTIGDLFVPIEMQQIYAAEVAANGRSDLLVQRAIRDVGHCTFSVPEIEEAYADLFAWVEEGDRPGGDDIFDLSSPTAGCAYTRPGPTPGGALRIFPCE